MSQNNDIFSHIVPVGLLGVFTIFGMFSNIRFVLCSCCFFVVFEFFLSQNVEKLYHPIINIYDRDDSGGYVKTCGVVFPPRFKMRSCWKEEVSSAVLDSYYYYFFKETWGRFLHPL